MVVLFSALMIVYLLLYQIKWDDIVDQLSEISDNQYNSFTQEDDQQLYQEETGLNLNQFDKESEYLEDMEEEQENTVKEPNSLFDDSLELKQSESTDKIIVLSGTSLWYGRVESVEKLWISYQYALRDEKDIYYVFLDPQRYKFDEIVKSLWWTTYTMTTEKELYENKLFWEKVTFINLPEYKETKVIMLVEINKTLWLIQVNYPIYHNSKSHIKQLFTN